MLAQNHDMDDTEAYWMNEFLAIAKIFFSTRSEARLNTNVMELVFQSNLFVFRFIPNLFLSFLLL